MFQTIAVLTPEGTAFAEVNDLAALKPEPMLIVKGLLFFEPIATRTRGRYAGFHADLSA